MNDKKQSVLKGFLQYFYGNFVVLILGFISLPLITRALSTKEYGRTSLFLSAVTMIYIFAILGFDQAYIRFFYKENVDKRKLMKQCMMIPVLLIVILSFVYFIFSKDFNYLLFGKTGIDVTILVILYTVTSVFERFLFLNIRMEKRGKLYSNLNILSKVLYILCIFVFVKLLGDDFRVGLFALTLPLFVVTIGLLFRYILVGRKRQSVEHSVKLEELIKYGVPFVPMLLMEWLLTSMDKWSIRFFHNFEETGIYSAAMQIMTILLVFKATFVAFWSPIAMEKYEKEPEEETKAFFVDMFEKVQLFGLLIAILLTAFRNVIVLILGESYRDAVKIIPFLSLMPVLSILFELTGQGIKFKGKTIYFNYAAFIAILVNLGGNLFLVPIYKGIGAAMVTAVTYIVYFILGTYFANKLFPVGYPLFKFAIAIVLYLGYATFVTFTNYELMSVCLGLLLILIVCLLNYKTIIDIYKKAFLYLKERS